MGAHTIIVVVKAVEHDSKPLLMSSEVLRELIKVQQTIMVDVTLKDYLGIQKETVIHHGLHRDKNAMEQVWMVDVGVYSTVVL